MTSLSAIAVKARPAREPAALAGCADPLFTLMDMRSGALVTRATCVPSPMATTFAAR